MLTSIGGGWLGRNLVRCTRGMRLQRHGVKNSRTMAGSGNNQSIVWMDMEMTGLNIFKDHILELACVITDKDLKVISRDFHVVIHQPDDILNGMDEWCTQHHGAAGLTDSSRNSKITVETAEQELLSFLKEHVPEKSAPLAGNSIYMDRLFLRTHMPLADEYLHYRIIDVSTIGELARRWNNPVTLAAPKKARSHRAVDDIRESIAQLKHYKLNFFKTDS